MEKLKGDDRICFLGQKLLDEWKKIEQHVDSINVRYCVCVCLRGGKGGECGKMGRWGGAHFDSFKVDAQTSSFLFNTQGEVSMFFYWWALVDSMKV